MPEEKRELSIHITDLNDLNKVLEALDNIFRTLILHYTDTNEKNAKVFIVSIAVYFGELMRLLGWNEKDFFGEDYEK